MDFIGPQRQDIDVVLAEPLQVIDILPADNMPFPEGPPLVAIPDDLGDIVGLHHSNGLFNWKSRQHNGNSLKWITAPLR